MLSLETMPRLEAVSRHFFNVLVLVLVLRVAVLVLVSVLRVAVLVLVLASAVTVLLTTRGVLLRLTFYLFAELKFLL